MAVSPFLGPAVDSLGCYAGAYITAHQFDAL